jgi:hypothetical protein
MNFAMAAAAAAVMSFVVGFVVHGVVLAPDYASLKSMFRPEPEMQGLFGWMPIAHVIFGIAFAWIYQKGREAKPFVGQGARFGLAVAALAIIPTYLIYYAIQPWPIGVVVKQIIFETIGIVLIGIVVAWVCEARARRAAA